MLEMLMWDKIMSTVEYSNWVVSIVIPAEIRSLWSFRKRFIGSQEWKCYCYNTETEATLITHGLHKNVWQGVESDAYVREKRFMGD